MTVLRHDGVELFYETHGSGPALLLTHGFALTAEMWAGQIEVLAPHFQVITWDMRGHGRSGSPRDPGAYSRDATVADMARLLEMVGAPDAVLGGLSLGGYMSLAFHLAHPERVRALIAVDTGPGFRSDAARAEWNASAFKTADQFESDGLTGAADGNGMACTAGHRDAQGLAHAARGMLAQPDTGIIASLPKIAVPTLVVVGENDVAFLPAADYMAAKIRGARKVVIPGAGHIANVDQPELFNTSMVEFLRDSALIGQDATPRGLQSKAGVSMDGA
ncbi:MAG TPA: alpha/beta fold hydrolase [Rhizomicrobium sp.]